MDADDAVIATNDDVTSCKQWAVHLGYWPDPYIRHFSKNAERRTPEISRGYFARVFAIDSVVKRFCEKVKPRTQIVNLGSGYDTMFWRLRNQDIPVRCFIDVDFPTVAAKKIQHIRKSRDLLQAISSEDSEIQFQSCCLRSHSYQLIGADLRNINDLSTNLAKSGIQYEAPTLFIAECVLVYMEIVHSVDLLSWIAQTFPNSVFINYEQVNMDDRFAEIMLSNLNHRGCSLAGVGQCQSLEKQRQRFTDTGWEGVVSKEMTSVFKDIPESEITRINRIEMLDEGELLSQLLSHYSLTIAWRDCERLGLKDVIPPSASI